MSAAQQRQSLCALPIKELRSRLTAARVDHSSCVEKEELVELLYSAPPPDAATPEGGGGAGVGGPTLSCATTPPPLRRCHRPAIREGLELLARDASARLWALAVQDFKGARSAEIAPLIAQGADPCRLWGTSLVPLAAAVLHMVKSAASKSTDAAPKVLAAPDFGLVLPPILNRWSALHIASFWGQERLVELLLAAPGVNVDARGGLDKYTPLRIAIEASFSAGVQNVDLIKLLLSHGASPNAHNGVETHKTCIAVAKAIPPSPRARLVLRLLHSHSTRPSLPFVHPADESYLADEDIQELASCAVTSFNILCEGKKPKIYSPQLMSSFSFRMTGGCSECRAYGTHSSLGTLDPLKADFQTLNARLSVCSVCEDVFYCSAKCQAKAWPDHKTVCKPVSPTRRTMALHLLDLGATPPQAVIDAAVKEFHSRSARGLQGADNPVPTFTNEKGARLYC